MQNESRKTTVSGKTFNCWCSGMSAWTERTEQDHPGISVSSASYSCAFDIFQEVVFCLELFTDLMQGSVSGSDLVIPGLVTNGTAKICCLGLILEQFYSIMVITNDLDNNWSFNKMFLIGLVKKC